MSQSRDTANSAVWDAKTKEIFIDLCVKEVDAGNRPTTYLNKEGWEHVIDGFKERTGREYTRTQLKNKWDQIKKDWKLWKDLKRGYTGLGWDPIKKTIAASDDWWKEKLEVFPHARKFRFRGIEPDLEEKLDMMFVGITARGVKAFASHQDLPDNLDSPQNEYEDVDESNDLYDDFSPTINTNTESSGSKRMRQSQGSRVSKKGSDRRIEKQLSEMLTVAKDIHKGESSDNPPSWSDAVMKVLQDIPEVYNDDPFFIFATTFLEDPNKRALFLSMPQEKRLKWLTHFYHSSSSTPSSSEIANMDPHKKSLFVKLLVATVAVVYEYYTTYLHKIPRMISSFNGHKWIGELMAGHPRRFHDMFRMSQNTFSDLLDELERMHGLHGSSRTSPREVLAMTLFILSHRESMRATCERFQHSSETVSRYFSLCIKSLVSLGREVIVPLEGSFDDTPEEIINDSRYYPFFKDCIGAMDGTHVDACVPVTEQVAYIGRCGSPTQNILACCDFNMCFTFMMAGWEGSAHDSRIFKFAARNPGYNFPMPPAGKYYVVDAGFPMERGFLKPYPDTKYHLPDFQRSNDVVRNRMELFNKRHSSVRGVIERTFGVWKKKWMILRNMPQYSMNKQIKIVIATTALHNFIRRHPESRDFDFDLHSDDETVVPYEAGEFRLGHSIANSFDEEVGTSQQDSGYNGMRLLRDEITEHLVNSMDDD